MRILIVDDSQELREMLADAISLFDWENLQAGDGIEALELYMRHNNQIDAILIDQIMPNMDGMHLLPKLLEINREVPVIMMTSYGSITLAVEFMKNGGSGFIEKPIVHFEVLKLRIEEAIQQAQRKKELEYMRASQHAADKLNVEKDAFLSNLSHELRTPLTIILPFASLAKQKLAKNKHEEAMVMLDKLLAGQERLLRFVSNIECLAQVYTGKFAFQPTTGDLVQLVQEVAQAMANSFAEKSLRWRVSGSIKLVACFDKATIKLALAEIMNNAIKFSSEGEMLEIIVTDVEEKAQVTIIDSGPGIPSGEQEAIFDPFTEGSHSRSRSGGTGLGLSVARSMAHLHGGTVRAENRKNNKGSMISLILPIQGGATK